MTEETIQTSNLKCVCPKHGDVGNYVYRVHMPEFGQERMTYCLVCAVEYLSMIAQEIKYVPVEESKGETE